MTFSQIYANFVTKKPVLVVFISLILLMIAVYGSGLVQNESTDYKSMLPKNNDVIAASNYFSDAFGGSDSVKIVVTLDKSYIDSDEPNTVCDPRVISYAESLKNYLESTSENFEEVSGAGDILRLMNGGTIPKSEASILKLKQKNPLLSKYISDDLEMLVINIRLKPSYVAEDVVNDIEDAINNVDTVSGIKVQGAGSEIASFYVLNELGPDMSRTGLISMIGIIIILVLTFMSIKYAFLPLVTIIVGVMWTFGFIGLVGIGMSFATSGVLSMIMGIGIDFGIQIINRFRQELANNKIEKAMNITLVQSLYPMFTTTLSAIIGFQAMGLGQLSFMKDMGNMMMYGVVFCFFAAITIVPALTIIIEKILSQLTFKRGNKVYKIR